MKLKNFTDPEIRIRKGDLSKRWYLEFYFLHPEKGTMERFQLHCGVNRFASYKKRLAELKEWAGAYKDLLYEGWSPFTQSFAAEAKRSDEALLKALAAKSKEVSPKTKESYTGAVKAFLHYLSKEDPEALADINSVKKATLNRYSLWMANTKNYTNKTRNSHIEYLRSVFSLAIELDMLKEENPCAGIRRLKTQGRKVHLAYEMNERKILLDYLEQNNEEALLRASKYIYYLGFRPDELRKVKLKYFLQDRMQFLVPGYVPEKANGHGDRQKIAKNGNDRIVAIPEAFQEEIKAMQLEKYSREWYLIGKDGKPGPYMLSKNYLSTRFRKIRERLGLDPQHTLYSWKHTASDDVFESANVSPADIKNHFDHHSIKQSEQYAGSRGHRISEDFVKNYPKML